MIGYKKHTFLGIHLKVIILKPLNQNSCILKKKLQKIVHGGIYGVGGGIYGVGGGIYGVGGGIYGVGGGIYGVGGGIYGVGSGVIHVVSYVVVFNEEKDVVE